MAASKTLRRILKSGFDAGTGVLGAQIQAARDEEERRAQRNKDIMAELLGYSRIDQSKAAAEASRARTEQILNPAEEQLSIAKVKGAAAQAALAAGDITSAQLLGLDDSGGGSKPKEFKTGIGDFEDIVTGRQEEAFNARDEAGAQILKSFPDLFLDINAKGKASIKPQFAKFTPEQLAEYAKENAPATIKQEKENFGYFKPWTWADDDVPNPALQGLSNINIPGEYRLSADASMGLQDSVTRAQDDPAYAAALLDAGGGAAQGTTTGYDDDFGQFESYEDFLLNYNDAISQGVQLPPDMLAEAKRYYGVQ